MLAALLALAALFALLGVARFGAARRAALMRRWPVWLFAAAALLALARGGVRVALIMAALAVLMWFLPSWRWARPQSHTATETAEEAEARMLLGVPAGAAEAQIRAAYRAKMARAHPDQGGGHDQAAKLTAARDLLLKRQKG